MWRRLKKWFKDLFKKESLNKKAKEARAIGLSDLINTCDHSHTLKKQTWVRISNKKFELQNEMTCTKCNNRKILPIG